jgi:hypothetical protein
MAMNLEARAPARQRARARETGGQRGEAGGVGGGFALNTGALTFSDLLAESR